MRSYSTPGVYFERDAAPPLIAPLRTDVAGFVGLAQRGPLNVPVRIESRNELAHVFGAPIPQAYLAYAAEAFFANGGQTCWIVRVADPANARAASLEILDARGDPILVLRASSPGTWGNQVVARWIAREGQILSITLHYPDGTSELVRLPSRVASLAADTRSPDAPNPATLPLVLFETGAGSARSPNRAPLDALEALLAGGADGLAGVTTAHFIGQGQSDGQPATGLAALEAIGDVSIVAMPDMMPVMQVVPRPTPRPRPNCRDLTAPAPLPEPPPSTIELPGARDIGALQQALIGHCEKLRYRVALLDTPDNLVPEDAIFTRDTLDSKFAAIYYPWILVDDPLQLTGLVRRVPPSGAVAGVYARNDRLYGVHRAPANHAIEGALDVGFAVDEIVHGVLNDADVNVLRAFPGRGIRVYGARTLSIDTLWRYINVRRLVSMIEKAIDRGTQWTVFEPNAASLRRELDRVIRAYLELLFRRGMLDGADSEAAYSVVCDETVNPPEAADTGQVICHVGVQPPLPAEFVVVVIGKTQHAIEVLRETGALDA